MRDEFNVVIDRFAGIDQSSEENILKLSSAVSAENMETDDGNLTVAPGYVKAIQAPVPGDKRITRLMAFPHGGAPEFIAAAENDLYAYKNGAWTLIKSFTAIENHAWDYVVARIGEVDSIIIANGEYPPIKYDGETVTDLNTETALPCVKYLAVHGERLVAAGDPDYPNRVYYSDSYALGDWGLGEVPGSGGGTIEIDPTAGDGISGLFAVFNTLLVMKNGRMWYLSGYTPGEYHVRRVFGEVDPTRTPPS
jgi:hypothetical protein